jgi:hypothetical protein
VLFVFNLPILVLVRVRNGKVASVSVTVSIINIFAIKHLSLFIANITSIQFELLSITFHDQTCIKLTLYLLLTVAKQKKSDCTPPPCGACAPPLR